jgi:hypothetical protein
MLAFGLALLDSGRAGEAIEQLEGAIKKVHLAGCAVADLYALNGTELY